jgi:hypothetical protein
MCDCRGCFRCVQGDAAAAARFDSAIAAAAKILDELPAVMKVNCRLWHLRTLVSLSARCRVAKAKGAGAVAAATGLPTAATSPLHRVLALLAVCGSGVVTVADRKTALEQALAAMPDVSAECGTAVRVLEAALSAIVSVAVAVHGELCVRVGVCVYMWTSAGCVDVEKRVVFVIVLLLLLLAVVCCCCCCCCVLV